MRTRQFTISTIALVALLCGLLSILAPSVSALESRGRSEKERRQLVSPSDETLEELEEELVAEQAIDEGLLQDFMGDDDQFEPAEDFYGSHGSFFDDSSSIEDTQSYEDEVKAEEEVIGAIESSEYEDWDATEDDTEDNEGFKGGKGHQSVPLPVKFYLFRYLTTPVLTALLITFLILLPVLSCGIYALATIQVPPHLMSTSKTMGVSQSKKNQ